MTQEEKAKAYDELKVKASRIYHKENDVLIMHTIEDLFPELKESEDEKIRKNLIGYIKGISKNEVCEETKDYWIAWLEKQGELIRDTDTVDSNEDGLIAKTIRCKNENQGEQKSADKVETKFHEGDWVVSPNGVYWHIDAIQNGRYEVTAGTGQCGNWPLDTNIYRLWTIQDAKDGEVLYECNEKKPFIFKELETKHIGDIASYCDIFNGIFNPNEDEWTTLDVVPATKEQRDTLMKAIADAGYTFDFEKKELKKIERKYALSEGDETMITDLSVIVHTYFSEISGIPFKYDLSEDKIRTWLKSLKNRVQPKQEWNEEDEDILNTIINHFKIDLECTENDDIIRWLKSLRPQNHWKPSDKQMHAFEQVYDWYNNNFAPSETLTSLYSDLKKLKGE